MRKVKSAFNTFRAENKAGSLFLDEDELNSSTMTVTAINSTNSDRRIAINNAKPPILDYYTTLKQQLRYALWWLIQCCP